MGEFRALMGKNWILYKRSMCGNIFEIFIPIFFVGFVIMVSLLNPAQLINQQSYQSNMKYSATVEYINNAFMLRNMCPGGSKIGFAPAGSTLITKIQAFLSAKSVTNFKDFPTETALEQHVRSADYQNMEQICWAIVISQETLGGQYNYKLRFNISEGGDQNGGPPTTLPLTSDLNIDLETFSTTVWGGMVGANHLINDIILGQQSGSTNNHLRQFISPAYQQQVVSNKIYLNLGQSVATMFLLPLLIIYLRQTSSMLSQKQSKVRQTMRIMGMKMRNYYATWFIRFIAVYLVVHSIASAILTYKLTMVPFYVPFILFIMFDIVIILQNYFIQVFLSRAKLGIVIALLFFALQFIVSFLATSTASLNLKTMLSIVPHCAFIFSFQNLLYFETAQMNASFTVTVNNYNLMYAVISFAGNIIVFLIFLWYFDQVIPSQWGAKRHPLFCCFQKQFRRPQQQRSKGKNKNVFEEVDNSFKIMERTNDIIEIQGLKKQFNGGDLIAVDNLNLKIYKNQIFVLLGHNGAGKTTTISMLTGLIQPTDGFISVFGQTQMDNIRKTLGLCPQHDTLYEDLTVQQHLELFSTFKGLQGQQKQKQVNKLIRDVNLMQKRDQYSKNLSGGQKRRLSVAISFAGKSKVIILDQPTSGMDTSARRYIWDLLKTYKNDRVIILTTHFMDQADFLGDRIGIMGSGELLCCGSSIFLKNRFGIGYNLTLVKQNSQVDSIAIIKKIQSVVPSSVVLSDVSAELAMQLPLSQTKVFSKLFHEIQARKSDLRIAEYGISITTLQQVFLRVAQQNQQNQKQILRQKNKPDETAVQLISYPASSSPQKLSRVNSQRRLSQNKSFANKSIKRLQSQKQQQIPRYSNNCVRFDLHFKATFIKRFRVIKRDIKSFLFQLLLPIIIVICAMLLMKISFIKDQPEQLINLQTYLSEQNPVLVPIGSSDSTLLASVKTSLNNKYLTSINVKDTSAYATAPDFDKLFLNPFKKAQATLKGGLYFLPSTVQAPNTVYPFRSMCITRGPTSPFFLQTLAAQTIINSQFTKDITITVSNHPLPLTYSQKSIGAAISGFMGAFVFTLGLAFKFASIISFIVKQRQDRVKHQQMVSGMKLSAYWIANFIYDYLLYLVIAVAAIIFCKIFNVGVLSSGTAFISTSMLFFFYGLAYIPFTYIAAFAYKEYGSAQSYYFFLTFLMGGMMPVLTFVFRIISVSSNKIGRYIAWGLRILPAFSFGEGIINLGSIDVYKNNQNDGNAIDPFALQISLAPILFLLGQFLLYFILLFIIQGILNSQKMMRCCTRQGSIVDSSPSPDSDVQQEYTKANKAKVQDYQIVTKHLRKVYMVDGRKSYKVAVDDLSFRIRRGEVFGLLGVNGAGKSTTFKMLSGEITSTSGDSYFCGMKISENLDKIRESLGYCPQFDALVETLTVRQQIQLYYDLKSLDSEFKERLVSQKIKELDLEKYSDKLSGTLSGGNKRKLSVAIAMIGNPKIIFLDQPSTGMDPKARRFMWRVISKIATEKKQSTIILTTHSMQQAQGLSTRLAIMVKGNFQCIGTPQYIKNKYGEGMELQIKLMHVDSRRIEEVISKKKLEKARIVSKSNYQEVLIVLQATASDRNEISEQGRASHIFQMLAREGKVPLELIVEYLEISFISKKLLEELSQIFGEIQPLETLQTFLRVKVKRKPNVGKLFDFFQSRKDHYGIQQYTIKQASVQQIFNNFAQGAQASEAGIS